MKIELAGISKVYGRKRALDKIRLEVPAGRIVAVVGLNGGSPRLARAAVRSAREKCRRNVRRRAPRFASTQQNRENCITRVRSAFLHRTADWQLGIA